MDNILYTVQVQVKYKLERQLSHYVLNLDRPYKIYVPTYIQ